MIKFPCPKCSTTITAADEHAGRKGKCPSCQEVMVIPGAPAKAAPPPPAPKKAPDDAPFVAEAIEPADVAPIDEDRPRRRPPARDDEIDDDRPRRRRSRDDYDDDDRPRRRSRSRGAYADCPNCGAPGDAHKVGFTWWGGIVGPAIISCVKCNECGTNYNGKHGDYNLKRILIYSVVVYGVIFGCCGGVALISAITGGQH